MEKMTRDLYAAMHMFGKLKIGTMFPEISKGDCMVLMSIQHYSREKGAKLTVSELADKIHAKPSAVSRTLKVLEDKDYIERTVNKEDRRNTYVTLTDEGEAEIKRVQETMDDFTEAVVSRMNKADIQKMIVCLNELYEIAQEEIELRNKKKGKEQ